ncbi:MAG: GyrI-like domain-containing protein [Planctomycetes bacterium]|nr:GyrI-like domain-containing protein [Planctomycetota bacterium]
MLRLVVRVLLALVLPTCLACSTGGGSTSGGPAVGELTDLPIARAPFAHVEANWKQRLDQAYVYVELVGSYTRIGKALESADRALREQGIEPSGPPFALYFDDPAEVPTEQLRARACFPVDSRVDVREPLACDLLPGTTVVYAYVAGPYPEVPRAYPGIFAFLERMRWREAGPIREIYWVHPGTVKDWSELVTEVQVPATARD